MLERTAADLVLPQRLAEVPVRATVPGERPAPVQHGPRPGLAGGIGPGGKAGQRLGGPIGGTGNRAGSHGRLDLVRREQDRLDVVPQRPGRGPLEPVQGHAVPAQAEVEQSQRPLRHGADVRDLLGGELAQGAGGQFAAARLIAGDRREQGQHAVQPGLAHRLAGVLG